MRFIHIWIASEVVFLPRMPKVACSIPAGFDRFSEYDNRRLACHMIMCSGLAKNIKASLQRRSNLHNKGMKLSSWKTSTLVFGKTNLRHFGNMFGSSLNTDINRNSYPGFSSGRPRGTTPADNRYIVLQARRNRRQTAGEIARHTTQATGRPISRFTVARRLHGGGLFARRPVRCVPLTPAHRRKRSLWCREHRNWRDNEWGRVLFTDESRFSLSRDSHLERAGKPQSSFKHH
ncbi:HTH_Tnp_Tc3_2 domain-containing protein [Trichonephila clavipes]|nr:HTH_Tnp_Tc3_2 domain-containing protein [Trichonephila clavipes]